MENDRKYKIYAYINKINKKIYIGQTCRTLRERAGKNGNLYLQCKRFGYAIRKYGWDNFYPIILLENLTKEQANICEIELINKYDTTNPDKGYNISFGGADNTYTAIDITGQRFGKLVALELVNNDKVGRYWLCQCDCGNTTIVRQDHLRNGTTKACKCGLATHKWSANQFIDKNDYIEIVLNDNKSFIIDKKDYKLIKDYRWYYDAANNRICETSTQLNIVKILFPQIKHKYSAKYVRYLNGNIFDLRKSNIQIIE